MISWVQRCPDWLNCLPLAQVYDKKIASLAEFNLQNGSSTLNAGMRPSSAGNGAFSPDKLSAACSAAAAMPGVLRVPRVVGTETLLSTRCKRSFSNAHTYHINSVALSSDCETFISADDLRVNLWHLDRQAAAGCCRCVAGCNHVLWLAQLLSQVVAAIKAAHLTLLFTQPPSVCHTCMCMLPDCARCLPPLPS
jgi:hypothetical protein